MKIKKLFSTIGIIFFSVSLFSQDTIKTESKIDSITVYRKGAQISRNLTKYLKKGRSVLVLEGLSSKIDKKTIKASANKGFTIISLSTGIEYLDERKSNKQIEKLRDKRDAFNDSIDLQKKLLSVLVTERDMILTNKSIGGQQQGVNIQDLKTAAAFFNKRLTEIQTNLQQEHSQTVSELAAIKTHAKYWSMAVAAIGTLIINFIWLKLTGS